jgi:outer membrane receptor for ferrienterochelin and colicins
VDWLSLVGGVRYTDYASQVEKVNPRAAAIIQASDNTTVKLLYGSAFRAPNNYELNYKSESQGFVSNPSLEAESLTSYELSVEQMLNKHHSINISVYRFSLDKLINSELIQTEAGQVSRFGNTQGAESQGVELRYNGVFNNGTRVVFSGDYVDAVDSDTDVYLTNSPHTSLFAGLYLPVYDQKVFISPQLRYVGKLYSTLGQQIDDSSIWNLIATSDNLIKDTRISIGVYNLLDETYYNSGSYLDLIPQMGRTALVQFSWTL